MASPYESRLIEQLPKKKMMFEQQTGIELTDPEAKEFVRRLNTKKMPSFMVGVCAIITGIVFIIIGLYDTSLIYVLNESAINDALSSYILSMYIQAAVIYAILGFGIFLVGLVLLVVLSKRLERHFIPIFADEINMRREKVPNPDMFQQGSPDSFTQSSTAPMLKSDVPHGPTLDTKLQNSAVNPTPKQQGRNCPVCGFQVATNVNFCPNCGAEISQFTF
jgi:hypothetical protein